MELNIFSDSVFATYLLFIALTFLPVKLGAVLFRAANTNMVNCAISVALGTLLSFICVLIIDGLTGMALGYIAVSFVYSRILGLALSWAFIFTFAVLLIQIGMMQALTDLGILV